MTTVTITTTDAEDAAILALAGKGETVEGFITRHARHQIDFAVKEAAAATVLDRSAAYAKLSPTDQAAVDALLSKARATTPKINPDPIVK